jgi:hypothetical protein
MQISMAQKKDTQMNPTAYKTYTYAEYEETITTEIDLELLEVVGDPDTFSIDSPTNNCYWNLIAPNRIATVGGDIDMGLSGNIPTFWQYGVPTKSPNTSNPAVNPHCNPAQTINGVNYPPNVDSGGQLRNSIYFIPLVLGGQKSLMFNGGMIYFNAQKNIACVIFTVAEGQYGNNAMAGNDCTLPVINCSTHQLCWGSRTPPPFNSISGFDWTIMQTENGNFSNATTGAIQFNQKVVPPPSS